MRDSPCVLPLISSTRNATSSTERQFESSPARGADNTNDMSRKRPRQSDSAFRTLTPDQQRAWLAYMRVQLRLTYEMNRQLQADSNVSLPDYDVLNALRYASGGRMRITALAARI